MVDRAPARERSEHDESLWQETATSLSPVQHAVPMQRPSHLTPTASTTGTERPFRNLYEQETPWLLRYFRRQIGSIEEATDLAHETMLRFLRAAPASEIATPQAYLRRIATNLLRDRAERGSTRIGQLSVSLVEGLDRADDFDPHRQLEGRQEMERWSRILKRLKPQTLEIFLLSRVEGQTYEEIGIRLGISVWSVKRHMAKAIDHVADHRKADR